MYTLTDLGELLDYLNFNKILTGSSIGIYPEDQIVELKIVGKDLSKNEMIDYRISVLFDEEIILGKSIIEVTEIENDFVKIDLIDKDSIEYFLKNKKDKSYDI
mgnify:CR=1 FL=1